MPRKETSTRRMNFASKENYRKWLAYDKMHIHPGPSSHPVDVHIRGKHHHVCHNCSRRATHHHKYPCCGLGRCCVENSRGEIMGAPDSIIMLDSMLSEAGIGGYLNW